VRSLFFSRPLTTFLSFKDKSRLQSVPFTVELFGLAPFAILNFRRSLCVPLLQKTPKTSSCAIPTARLTATFTPSSRSRPTLSLSSWRRMSLLLQTTLPSTPLIPLTSTREFFSASRLRFDNARVFYFALEVGRSRPPSSLYPDASEYLGYLKDVLVLCHPPNGQPRSTKKLPESLLPSLAF